MPRYLPFLDGPWRLAMGIKALDLAEWIEVDECFAAQLTNKILHQPIVELRRSESVRTVIRKIFGLRS